MTYIRLDPLGTTTCLTLTSVVDEVADTIDNDTATASLTSTVTTALSNTCYASCDMANKYIDSLSDQQLVEMTTKLEQKENELSFTLNDNKVEIELPKVYKK